MLKGFSSREASLYYYVRYLVNMSDLDEEKMNDFESAVATKNEIALKQLSWINPESKERTLQTIKECFKAVHEFLKNLYLHERESMKDIEVQRGIRAIMLICGEAVHNLDKFTDFLNVGNQSISQIKEYQELLEFYQKKLVKRLKKLKEQEEIWKNEWGETTESSECALTDLRDVIFDKHYELFYLKKENGSRFFSHSLLKRVKLVRDFYQIAIGEFFDNPNLICKRSKDISCYRAACIIKEKLLPEMSKILGLHIRFNLTDFYKYLAKCIYAMILASSTHNTEAKGARKPCLEYYTDAWKFLKEAIGSADYSSFLEKSKKGSDKEIQTVITFVNKLCFMLFTGLECNDQVIGVIYRLLKKDKANKDEYVSVNSKHFWNSVLEERNFMHEVLMKYPNSPLYNTVDNIYYRDGFRMFEPLVQLNFPSSMYTLHNEKFKPSVLRLPAPTHQEYIHIAKESNLFRGFIEGLKQEKKGGSLLIFNLQDRTSWEESARSVLLEGLPDKAMYKNHVYVCTLTRSSDFYHQCAEYEKLNDAKDFKNMFLDQLSSEEACGFFYDGLVPKKELCDFSKKCISLIHEYFFSGKDNLSVKNRQDFIEIFYYFFSLKIIDAVNPTYLSFSCKDAVDIGPTMYTGFYGFAKLMGLDPEWSREEEDFFSYLLFMPAMMVRQRIIKAPCTERMLSALSTINAELDIQRAKVIGSFEKLFGYKIFKNLCVEEIKD